MGVILDIWLKFIFLITVKHPKGFICNIVDVLILKFWQATFSQFTGYTTDHISAKFQNYYLFVSFKYDLLSRPSWRSPSKVCERLCFRWWGKVETGQICGKVFFYVKPADVTVLHIHYNITALHHLDGMYLNPKIMKSSKKWMTSYNLVVWTNGKLGIYLLILKPWFWTLNTPRIQII